jgi:hypothetical protein
VSEAPGAPDRGVASSTAAGLRNWIASGACQDSSGAFAAWLDLDTGGLSYAYPEITGYALTFLAGQAALSDRENAVALRAAEWLALRVERGNLAARDGWDNDAVYLFDLGMIASGLMSFGGRAQARRYVDRGLGLTCFLADELRSSAHLSPIATGGPRPQRRSWSTHGQAHLAKLVQALLLAEAHGGRSERALAAELIDEVKRLQQPDGRMQTGRPESQTMLHPHLYAAEGLWIWGSAAADRDALERARAAVEWVWAHQLETGGCPRSVGDGSALPDQVEQSDVTAQAVRLALSLDLPGEAANRAIARLIDVSHGPENALAVLYQPASASRHLSTWSTLFAAQALVMVADPGHSLAPLQLV